ncbi:uncharacterized protein BKA78DRAFT_365968 [Phyllosticta capitalensis]|uniref:uncharacterized protein n=1 Tax=Phyllosticta capitalensis TaxID=121624 RepID=UPI00312E1541
MYIDERPNSVILYLRALKKRDPSAIYFEPGDAVHAWDEQNSEFSSQQYIVAQLIFMVFPMIFTKVQRATEAKKIEENDSITSGTSQSSCFDLSDQRDAEDNEQNQVLILCGRLGRLAKKFAKQSHHGVAERIRLDYLNREYGVFRGREEARIEEERHIEERQRIEERIRQIDEERRVARDKQKGRAQG